MTTVIGTVKVDQVATVRDRVAPYLLRVGAVGLWPMQGGQQVQVVVTGSAALVGWVRQGLVGVVRGGQ